MKKGGEVFLPVRLHLFFKGISGLFACINRSCGGKEARDPRKIVGKVFSEPRIFCDVCNARVFEIYTHRLCGAAYLKGFVSMNNHDFLFDANRKDTSITTLKETHLAVEMNRIANKSRSNGALQIAYLD